MYIICPFFRTYIRFPPTYTVTKSFECLRLESDTNFLMLPHTGLPINGSHLVRALILCYLFLFKYVNRYVLVSTYVSPVRLAHIFCVGYCPTKNYIF